MSTERRTSVGLKGDAVQRELERSHLEEEQESGPPAKKPVIPIAEKVALPKPVAALRPQTRTPAGGKAAVPTDGRLLARQKRNEKLIRELGPLATYLQDPLVSDIWRNTDGTLWLNKIGEPVSKINWTMSDDVAYALIGIVGEYMKKTVDEAHPTFEGVFPHDHCRFTAVVPPAVKGGPAFCIRKHSKFTRTFDDYVRDGSLTREQMSFLLKRIRARDNVLIVGGTGSGKTTFANAVLREMSEMATPDERFVIIEDTAELNCEAPNRVELLTCPGVTVNDLLRTSMRLSPKRICVGELRGPEALDLLKAWNTGHEGGITTIHAKNAKRALDRLEDLVEEAGVKISKRKIVDAVNLIVVVEADYSGHRRITEIKRLTASGTSSEDYGFSDR